MTAPAETGTVTLDVVIPVFNEEKDLGPCVHRLHDHLTRTFPYPFRITIADNASTDGTPEVAAGLAAGLEGVRSTRLEEKGRGRALKRAWTASASDVLVYMDVDLSTDLGALMPLVAPLLSGHSDVAIGTRLRHSSRVARGPRREIVSRGYNLLLRGTLRVRFSDAQCGFKAVRREAAVSVGVTSTGAGLVAGGSTSKRAERSTLCEQCTVRVAAPRAMPSGTTNSPDTRVARSDDG